MSYDEILASIDGALADGEFPDAMRWSPEPETVDAPAPFDGTLVWQPPQRYEGANAGRPVAGAWPALVDWALQAEQQRERFAPAIAEIGRLLEELAERNRDTFRRFELTTWVTSDAPSTHSPRVLRDDDPRAYALQLRRSRGTGPDRQIQHQPRPRIHR